MNDLIIYQQMKAAIDRASEKYKVVINNSGVWIGKYESPCYTATEIHHYLNGLSDGKGKSKP